MPHPPRIIAIVGATATGKTTLSETLAREIDGEIVCADSRQVFRDLEIGTGKPDPDERASRPHHLFDALALDDAANAGWYQRAALSVCAGVHARGRTAVLVGGSGLYVQAAMQGLAPVPPSDPDVRTRLRARASGEGATVLHAHLAEVDAASAARIDPGDVQRIVRALEVFEVSGRPLSWWHTRPRTHAVPGRWQVVEITLASDQLRERIVSRTGAMFSAGLVEETHGLIDRGHGAALERLRAIGYDEAMALLRGDIDRAGAEARTSLRTLQLAKRQRTCPAGRS
jgi:tRNA dimethylallyltransferase